MHATSPYTIYWKPYYYTYMHAYFMQWLEEEFLTYLSEWETSVQEREGFSKLEKKAMLLSSETLLGIRITGI